MASIVGGITTSHVPAIGGAIAKGRQNEPYWKPFFDGFIPVRQWLDEVKPERAKGRVFATNSDVDSKTKWQLAGGFDATVCKNP